MNTVADKLMKLVQTKSDIRQALLDKGFNVPDTMPFSGYADLIRRFPCNAKDFPDIPGMIARWSAKGLTNEDMSTNPVWKDLTGNGHDLQMKNFGWAGMSGVNGYVEDYNNSRWFINNSITATKKADSFKITSISQVTVQLQYIAEPSQSPYAVPSYTIRVTGLTDGQTVNYRVSGGISYPIKQDGVYTLPGFDFAGKGSWYGFQFNKVQESCNITIEQLPLYPGALVFDGVDDYGVCDNFPILTKEKGYTVVALRQWMETTNKVSGVVSNSLIWFTDGAFVLEYRNINTGYENTPVSFGRINPNAPLAKSAFTYQTSLEYNGVKINTGTYKGVSQLTVGSANKNNYLFKGAIWEIVILDHDATEEELQKIQDYYKQEYPWLFPDQAWTVVGKTNEDTDRATIANITGNGNNLVLSNFGFAENSGYGLYGTNYTTWTNPGRATYTVSLDKIHITKVSSVPQSDFIYVNGLTKLIQKIKVTGLPQGVKLRIGRTDLWTHEIATDGIYNINVTDSSESPLIGYNIDTLLEFCDITIEQIPEYEGYLVTDGVDDQIRSSAITMGKDFTVVTESILIQPTENNVTGIVKPNSFSLYNYIAGVNTYINRTGTGYLIRGTRSIKAFSSDGRLYSDDWSEHIDNIEQTVSSSVGGLTVGYSTYGATYTKLAFKNLAIYSEVLSKEDCIKAYNYLQTLKS